MLEVTIDSALTNRNCVVQGKAIGVLDNAIIRFHLIALVLQRHQRRHLFPMEEFFIVGSTHEMVDFLHANPEKLLSEIDLAQPRQQRLAHP